MCQHKELEIYDENDYDIYLYHEPQEDLKRVTMYFVAKRAAKLSAVKFEVEKELLNLKFDSLQFCSPFIYNNASGCANNLFFFCLLYDAYSRVPNTSVGRNKRVGRKICRKLINM